MMKSLRPGEAHLVARSRDCPTLLSLLKEIVERKTGGDIGRLSEKHVAKILRQLPPNPKAKKEPITIAQMESALRQAGCLLDNPETYRKFGIKEMPPRPDYLIKEAFQRGGLLMLECSSSKTLIKLIRETGEPFELGEDRDDFRRLSTDGSTIAPDWIILPATLVPSRCRINVRRNQRTGVTVDRSRPTPKQLLALHAYVLLSGQPYPRAYNEGLSLTNEFDVVVGRSSGRLFLSQDRTNYWNGRDVYEPVYRKRGHHVVTGQISTWENDLVEVARKDQQLNALFRLMADRAHDTDLGDLTRRDLSKILRILPVSRKAARQKRGSITIRQMEKILETTGCLLADPAIYKKFGVNTIPPLSDSLIKKAFTMGGRLMVECSSPKKQIAALHKARHRVRIIEDCESERFSEDKTKRTPQWTILPRSLGFATHISERERLGSRAISFDDRRPSPEQLFGLHAYLLLSGPELADSYKQGLALTNRPGVVVGQRDGELVYHKDLTCGWCKAEWVYEPYYSLFNL